MIELLKQQLSVKDEQIASANRLADQAQRLDLTTHKQTNPKEIDVQLNKEQIANKHGWFWKLTH